MVPHVHFKISRESTIGPVEDQLNHTMQVPNAGLLRDGEYGWVPSVPFQSR